MAFTGSYVCTTFATKLLAAQINSTDTFRLALYDSTATLTDATTAYTATGELATAGGYTAGGATTTMTISTASTSNGTVVIVDFSDVNWVAATFTCRGAMLYDDTAAGNPAMLIMDFGTNKSPVAATFTVTFPAATANAGMCVFQSVLTNP